LIGSPDSSEKLFSGEMNLLHKLRIAIVLVAVTPGISRANNGSVAVALPVADIVVDGDLSEWSEDLPRYPIALNIFGDPLGDEDDFRGSYRVGYDEKNLRIYAAFEIHDDSFVTDAAKDGEFDSITVSLSAEHGVSGAIGQRVWHRGTDAIKDYPHSKFGMKINGSRRTYEVRLDLPKFGLGEKPSGPFTCSWTAEVNDADADGSESYLCWSPEPWKMLDKQRQGDLVVIPASSKTQLVNGRPNAGRDGLFGFSLVQLQSTDDSNLTVAIRTDEAGEYNIMLPRGNYRRRVSPRLAVVADEEIVVGENPVVDTLNYVLSADRTRTLRVHREWKQGSGRFVSSESTTTQFEPQRMVRQFDSTDRLPSTTIHDLAQSHDSTIWAGTETGVFSFDGVRVRHYEFSRTSDVFDIEIVQVGEREEIWVGTSRGLFIIDPRAETFTTVGRLESRRVQCIKRGHDGKMLVATSNGLFREGVNGFQAFAPRQGGVTRNIHSLTVDPNCTWVGTDGGLFRYVNGTFELQSINSVDRHRVTALHLDNNGALWIGTSSSLLRFADNEFRVIHTQDKERYRYVRDIAEDHDGDLWVAAWDGTIHITNAEKTTKVPRYRHEASAPLSDLTVDHENNRWISFENSGSKQLTCVNAKVEKYTSLPCFQVCVSKQNISFVTRHAGNWRVARRLRDSNATQAIEHWQLDTKPTVLLDNDETFLVGTVNGLWELRDGSLKPHRLKELQSDEIVDLHIDKQNVLWVAVRRALFRVDGDHVTDMRRKLQLRDERPTAIDEHNGKLAISTLYGMSLVEDDRLVDQLSKDNGLRSNIVYALKWARDGALWIATSEGLQSYGDEQLTNYLPAGSAKKRRFGEFMTEDSDGRIWVGSEAGITVVDPTRNLVQLIHSTDYFGNAEIHHATADGEDILVASTDGLFRYRRSSHKPGLVMDQITTDRQLGAVYEAKLTTDEPLLAFNFHATSPTHRNGSALYRYRLKGLDNEWTDTYATQVKYSNLPQGQYAFEVQAFNQDLKSSDLLTVPITVDLPYQRYATTVTMGLSLLGLVGVVIWTMVKQTKEKEVLAAQVKEEVEEKLLLSEQLRNAQKLESLGTLAAGVAHDFNNSLQATMMNAELGLREEKHIDKIHEYLRDISKTSQQASELTKSLLLFGGRASGVRQPANVNDIVHSCAKMIRRTIPSSIEVRIDTSPDDLWANVDESQIHQVLVNLCINARDAMPNGGVLRLATSSVTTDEGTFVRVRVIDNGEGIPADVVEQVFDPFFTSKPREKGTGLGLSIVHGVVASHNGTVNLRSTLEAGTEFEISLPACDEPSSPSQIGAESHKVSRKGFILVADDQASVRQTLRQGLEMFSYQIEDTENGIDAMKLFGQYQHELDSIILDIDMPGLDGVTVMNKIRATGWLKPIVLITGYPTNTPKLDGNSCLIRKPFTLQQILAAVESPTDQSIAESNPLSA